jgi:hypothetical protein
LFLPHNEPYLLIHQNYNSLQKLIIVVPLDLINVEYNTQSDLTIIPNGNLTYLSSIYLTYIGGSNDLDVIYTSKTNNCKIINNRVIGLKAGACKIKATKPGNNLYKSTTTFLMLLSEQEQTTIKHLL